MHHGVRTMSGAATLALLLALVAAAAAAAPKEACLLKLEVMSSQSPWTSGGTLTVPTQAIITENRLNATGHIYLEVPSSGVCPPPINASNAVELLGAASLALPVEDSALSFVPSDIKSNVTTDPNDPTVAPISVFDFNGITMGLTGTEPLGPGAVTLGNGSAAEARATVAPLCSQLIILGGVLDLTSLLGPRTADVKNVAYNRSMAAGASIKKNGADVGAVTLVVRNASLFLDVSPETIPGVLMSRARYLLSGDIVATADLSDVASWEVVPSAEVDWATITRFDAPVVIATDEPGPPPPARVIGVNDTLKQECVPSRIAGGANGTAAAPAAAKSSAAPWGSGNVSVMAAVVAALLALLIF